MVIRGFTVLICCYFATRCWCGYLSWAKCELFTNGSADSHLIIFCFVTTQNGLPFWCWLARCPEKER